MNLEQTFIPTKILKEGEKFLNNGQVLQTTKVNFIIYAEEALSDIARQERMYFSDEET